MIFFKCEEDIQKYLNRRKPGQSKFTTQRQEEDKINNTDLEELKKIGKNSREKEKKD